MICADSVLPDRLKADYFWMHDPLSRSGSCMVHPGTPAPVAGHFRDAQINIGIMECCGGYNKLPVQWHVNAYRAVKLASEMFSVIFLCESTVLRSSCLSGSSLFLAESPMVCTSLKWHNIVSVCIFVLISKWVGRSRREGFLNLPAVPEVMH